MAEKDQGERIAAIEAIIPMMLKSLDSLNENIRELNATINKSKGAFWALMGISSLVGAIVAKVVGAFTS